MNGIRCVLVDANGVVAGYFVAADDNPAINSSERDRNGCACVPHDQAMTGDTLIDCVWTQSPANQPGPDL